MSNLLSFEKFAELAPIEGLIDGMKNVRLSYTQSGINNLRQVVDYLPAPAASKEVGSIPLGQVKIDASGINLSQTEMFEQAVDSKQIKKDSDRLSEAELAVVAVYAEQNREQVSASGLQEI